MELKQIPILPFCCISWLLQKYEKIRNDISKTPTAAAAKNIK